MYASLGICMHFQPHWVSEVLPEALRLEPDHAFVSDPLPLPAMTSGNESPGPGQASGQGKDSIHGEGQVHGTGLGQGKGQGQEYSIGKGPGKSPMPYYMIRMQHAREEEQEMIRSMQRPKALSPGLGSKGQGH